ncbi:hypothetical protein NXS19_009249 [Fusarium pseudograminearum]|nr:hypothetical protein NXS19_009249 [Fusarium pseudograminearum]
MSQKALTNSDILSVLTITGATKSSINREREAHISLTAIVSVTALNYIIISTTCTSKPNRKPNHNPYDDALHILHNYPRGCEHLIPHM